MLFSMYSLRKSIKINEVDELFVRCRSRQIEREDKLIQNFLARADSNVNEAYDAEGPFFMTTLALMMMKPADWEKNRVIFLQKLLITAHIRSANTPNDRTKYVIFFSSLDKPHSNLFRVASKALKPFATYKTTLVFFGLINAFFVHMLKPVGHL